MLGSIVKSTLRQDVHAEGSAVLYIYMGVVDYYGHNAYVIRGSSLLGMRESFAASVVAIVPRK